MKLTVRFVEIEYVHAVWPQVEDFIIRALKQGQPYSEAYHPYTEEHVLQFLASGQWLLLVGVDDDNKIRGAGTLAFTNYPLFRAAILTTLGGEFLANPKVLEQTKQIAKARGATVLQAYCRDSMVRLAKRSGFEPHNRLVEQQI